MFEVIDSHEEGYAPLLQWACYARIDMNLEPGRVGDRKVAKEALKSSNSVDKALCHISFEMCVSPNSVNQSAICVLRKTRRLLHRHR